MKNNFEKVKNWLNLDVTDEILIALIFEMTRKKDKEFVIELQKIQKNQPLR